MRPSSVLLSDALQRDAVPKRATAIFMIDDGDVLVDCEQVTRAGEQNPSSNRRMAHPRYMSPIQPDVSADY
jgi:hypothetical protein